MTMAKLTATVERDKSFGAILGELNIKRGNVGLEGQAGCNVVGVAGLVAQGTALCPRKLVTSLEITQLREVLGGPNSIAVGVTIVAALVLGGAVEPAVKVEFLTGVVLMNVLAETGDLVNGVLNRPDTTVNRVLGDADRVTQTPTNDVTVSVVDGLIVLTHVTDVEAADLSMAGLELLSISIVVRVGATGNQKGSWRTARKEQGASGVVGVGHVADESAVAIRHGAIPTVVGP
jgi:hypothetical protein